MTYLIVFLLSVVFMIGLQIVSVPLVSIIFYEKIVDGFWNNLIFELKIHFKQVTTYIVILVGAIIITSSIVSASHTVKNNKCPQCGYIHKMTSTEGENK